MICRHHQPLTWRRSRVAALSQAVIGSAINRKVSETSRRSHSDCNKRALMAQQARDRHSVMILVRVVGRTASTRSVASLWKRSSASRCPVVIAPSRLVPRKYKPTQATMLTPHRESRRSSRSECRLALEPTSETLQSALKNF